MESNQSSPAPQHRLDGQPAAPRPSQVFIKMLLEAIIYGRKNGIPMNVMESGFQHAWLHAELLGLEEVPPIPTETRLPISSMGENP